MAILKWLFGSKKPAEQSREQPRSPAPMTPAPMAPAAMPRAKHLGPEVSFTGRGFPLDVVGESNYQTALQQIRGGHNRHGHEVEATALLKRQTDNPYDSNAVVVLIKNRTVGYLAREQAARISQKILEDDISEFRCNAKIVGGWRTNQYDQGHFGVKLAVPNRGWVDFGLGKSDPNASSRLPGEVKPKSIVPMASPTGPMVGQWIVLWGAKRDSDLAKELAGYGAHIMASIGKSTTMLVHVEDELTPGAKRSATYRKAQERIDERGQLEILSLTALRERLERDEI